MTPHLDNPSEKATSESKQIKEQNESIKLLNEEAWILHQKLNKSVHGKLLPSD